MYFRKLHQFEALLLTLYDPLQEQVERCDQNVDDHEDYQHRMRACDEWLKSAHLQLEESKDRPADQETLQSKLQAVEVRH